MPSEPRRSTFCNEEKEGVAFIGHYEPDRGEKIQLLLDHRVPVTVAGIHWESFAEKNTNKPFTYLGKGVFGEHYSRTLSKAKIALGFLSKIIPELHTTRNFEIPACGTAMVAERNEELSKFFSEDEVLFYSDNLEFKTKVLKVLHEPSLADAYAEKARTKVTEEGFDYRSILRKLCLQMNLPVYD